jgi:hypothetical protein
VKSISERDSTKDLNQTDSSILLDEDKIAFGS